MANINMAYDHPIYTNRVFVGGNTGASAGYRFAAYTDMLVKSITIKPAVPGTTAAQIFHALKSVAASTAVTTNILTTFGSAGATGVQLTSTLTLAVGDSLSIYNTGTDATGVYAVGVELQIIPGANVTS